ncbi:MAG: hypothetical protein IKZ88_09510 [Neisseriaceae bacterium]|nr:hypothetical protein [Neisseriaceae bacterium]
MSRAWGDFFEKRVSGCLKQRSANEVKLKHSIRSLIRKIATHCLWQCSPCHYFFRLPENYATSYSSSKAA